MTAPRPPQFDRAAAKAAGYTDAEIDAFLASQSATGSPPPRPTPRIASESTGTRATLRNATPEQVAANRATDLRTAIGTAREFAQGVTFGFADEIEGGVRSLGGTPYRTARDQVRAEGDAFREEHPVLSTAANLAGGVATGVGALKAGGAVGKALAPVVRGTATAGQRARAAAQAGAVAGGLTGAGTAEELADVPARAAGGIVAGGVTGAAASGLTDVIRRGRQLLGTVGAGETAGPVRRLIQGEMATPEVAGRQRVLQAIGEAGGSLDDVAAASATAPDGTALAELIPRGRGVAKLRVARNAGRERDLLDGSLAERAAEEPANWYRAVAKGTGVDTPRDAAAYGAEQLTKVKPTVQKLYTQAARQPDVESEEIAGVVQDLAAMGETGILKRARKIAVGRNTLAADQSPTTTISVRNLQFLRRAIDRRVDVLRGQATPDEELAGLLLERRAVVDRVLKAAGGKAQRRADKLWEAANARGEAFALGQRVESVGTAEGVGRLAGEARSAKGFRTGAASKTLERAANVADGEAGQVRNPVSGPLASATRRARTRAGFPDDAAFEEARQVANQIVARLRTQRAVSGNSTTAANLAEMADEFGIDVGTLMRTGLDPVALAKAIVSDKARALASGTTAAQATEMGRVLGAGLPGQMSRDAAVQQLQDLLPSITTLYRRNAALQGQAAGQTARLR